MVSGNSERIQLELVIDQAELERQLGTVFQSPGGGVPGGVKPALETGSKAKPMMVDATGKMASGIGSLAKLSGIALGITALVKSSQVVGTTIGALNSVLFAMVDSFLAPLVPLLLPLLTKLTKGIAPAAQAGQNVADTVSGLKTLATGKTPGGKTLSPEELSSARKEVAGNIGKDLLDIITPEIFGKDIFRGPTQLAMKEQGRGGTQPKFGGLNPFSLALDLVDRFKFGMSKGAQGSGRQEFLGREMDPQTLQKLSGFDDASLKRFLEISATRPNVNINIDAGSIEEMISKVRDELNRLTRDDYSRGYLGGG